MDAGARIQLYVILRVVLLPAGASVLALVAARLFGRGEATVGRLGAVGAATGAIAAYLGIAGLPSIPPVDTLGWIPFATAATLLLLLPLDGRRLAERIALFAAFAAAAFLVGKPVFAATDALRAGLWIVLAATIVTVATEGLVWASRRVDPRAVLFGVTAVAIGASLASVASHSALLSLILGGVAAMTGALAVLGLLLKVRPHGRATFAVIVVPIAGLVLYGHLYSSLPVSSLGLLAAAALALPVAAAFPPFRGRTILAPLLAAVLALGAAGLAQREGAAQEGSAEDMYR